MNQNSRIPVALIEDNEVIRSGVRDLLNTSKDFYCAADYGSAEEALKADVNNRISIVLLDIQLPGQSGTQALGVLKGSFPGAQFIMYTIHEDDDNIFNALRAGANGYILKRCPPEQVLAALTELHNGGSPMSTDIARKVVAYFQKTRAATTPAAALLTNRELEIVNLLADGYLYKEIAERLNMAVNTVKKHLYNVYEKLHVQNRTEAVNKVFNRSNG